MKILVISQFYKPEPFRISDICESLAERGHDVYVLTGLPNYPGGTLYEEYKNKKNRKEVVNDVNIIRSYEFPRGKGSIKLFINYMSFAVFGSLKVKSLHKDFDVIFVNQLSPVFSAIPGIVYKRKFKKKLVLYCLDLWPESLQAGGLKRTSLLFRIFKGVSKRIYLKSDKILVTSEAFITYFQEYLKLNNKDIEYLPQYAENIFGNIKIKEKINFKNINFVFAGNIGDMQSVETIVKTANILKHHKNITFHVIGDGSRYHNVVALSKNLELQNVIFYGKRPIEEMPKYYSLADAMIVTLKDNTSISYTIPGKVQSYMAAGKPIIGCINGETQKIIKESRCGYYCDAENPKKLSIIILRFIQENNIYQMGKNSRKFYMENFQKTKFIEKLVCYLKEME